MASSFAHKEVLSSKNFADIRIRLGHKKMPDLYGKSVNMADRRWVDEVESIPSGIDNDQWAEIANYNFLKLKQQEQKEKDTTVQR